MILLALGSNQGDRQAHLAQAREMLQGHGVVVLQASSVLETPALMPPGAPPNWDVPYLNQVLAVETTLDAPALLALAKRIEHEIGRRPSARWAPRPIDVDVIAHHGLCLNTPELTVPHALMHQRRFVLQPLCDIAPDWVHPVLGQTARALLEALPP